MCVCVWEEGRKREKKRKVGKGDVIGKSGKLDLASSCLCSIVFFHSIVDMEDDGRSGRRRRSWKIPADGRP